jgi:hypothetical protein
MRTLAKLSLTKIFHLPISDIRLFISDIFGGGVHFGYGFIEIGHLFGNKTEYANAYIDNKFQIGIFACDYHTASHEDRPEQLM